MKKIGITLSGGGARGAVHLGVLKALTELGITPHIMSGSSAGAIVGAFYAAGHTPEQILTIAKELGIGLFNPFHITLLGDGLINMDCFREVFERHLPEHFDDLHMPLYVTATDILRNETVYFSQGELAPVLMATACVPVIFVTQQHNGHSLHDGGILNNLPTEIIRDKCDLLIGVHTNSLDTTLTAIESKSQLVDRAFHMAIDTDVQRRLSTCDLRIEPPRMTRYGMFDVRHVDEMWQVGYDHVMGMRAEVEALRARAEMP